MCSCICIHTRLHSSIHLLKSSVALTAVAVAKIKAAAAANGMFQHYIVMLLTFDES